MFLAKVHVTLRKSILDPQGKAVTHGLKNMGIAEIENVRIGKHITLEVEADTKEIASEKVETACKKLLSNPIMESFHFSLQEN